MKQASIIGLGIAAFLAFPALAQETKPLVKTVVHHHVYHHLHRAAQTAAVAPSATAVLPSFFPHIAPYPPGQGDTDGLSRDPNDCNKGCIGEP